MPKTVLTYEKKEKRANNEITDIIRYTDDGIQEWFLWSEELNDYIDIDLNTVKLSRPLAFEKLEEKLKDQYNENLMAYIEGA